MALSGAHYLLKELCITIATRYSGDILCTCEGGKRTDHTDQHVTNLLGPKSDLHAWNVLCEASRHDDPAIKNIADESTVHV
jgi:hypothetical protein